MRFSTFHIFFVKLIGNFCVKGQAPQSLCLAHKVWLNGPKKWLQTSKDCEGKKAEKWPKAWRITLKERKRWLSFCLAKVSKTIFSRLKNRLLLLLKQLIKAKELYLNDISSENSFCNDSGLNPNHSLWVKLF